MILSSFSKSYGGRTVLDMPELTIEHGEIYALIGANGSGKSTFAKILAGIEPTDGGKAPVTCVSIGYMPQKNFAFRMSLEKNILLNGGDREKAEKLMEALELKALASTPAKKLSGGETARMALARLLMREYELLILDEPTAAMDMVSTKLSEKLIEDYVKKTGCAVLLVTHSLQQARRMADEVLYFDSGKLCEKGKAEKLLYSPDSESLKQFLEFYGT